MEPSAFFGHFLGAFLAAMPPGACDSRGVCHPWHDERRYYAQPYYPPAPRYYQPAPQPQPQQQDSLGAQVKGEILQFCAQHPEEHFCGTLETYLQQHPNAR
jgi:hypothetical protein